MQYHRRKMITSTIATASVERLKGNALSVLIKASHAMLAIED
jgi:molybdopterin-binding protein